MTKAQIAILWGLAALIVLIFVLVGRVLSRPPQLSWAAATAPARVYSLPGVPYSARNLYSRADQAARSWQEDARLISAAASWSFANLDGFSRPVDWTFQFFSPGKQRIYVVNVSETEVTTLRDALSPYPLVSVPAEQWQLDSYEALNRWLNHGGGNFMRQYPVVDVTMRLRESDGGHLEWGVVGIVRDSQTMHLVRVDAADGSILQ